MGIGILGMVLSEAVLGIDVLGMNLSEVVLKTAILRVYFTRNNEHC